MRVLIPIWRGRVSPLLDVARRFLLVNLQGDSERERREVRIDETGLALRCKRMAQLNVQVLICGAISRPLEEALASEAVRIIPNTCGPVDQVLEAFRVGRLTGKAFLMPGCSRQLVPIQARRGGDGPEK